MKVKDWLRLVRGKHEQDETYVDGSELSADPEGPYRARLGGTARHHAGSEGIDVGEREVVRGELQLVYRVHCPCTHHWDETQFQRLSLCPKCGRAVVVDPPQPPAGRA
jgi:hypothetical protein